MNRKLLTTALMFTLLFSVVFMSCKNDTDKRGNIVTVRLTSEPERLNPLTTEEANAMQVMNNIFLSLLDFDPQSLDLVPVIAKSRPSVSLIDTGKYKGGSAYTYEIRDEAMWDNGKPITAADYVFTVKAVWLAACGRPNDDDFNIDATQTIDDRFTCRCTAAGGQHVDPIEVERGQAGIFNCAGAGVSAGNAEEGRIVIGIVIFCDSFGVENGFLK